MRIIALFFWLACAILVIPGLFALADGFVWLLFDTKLSWIVWNSDRGFLAYIFATLGVICGLIGSLVYKTVKR